MRLLPLFGALALVAASGISAARAEPGGCLKYGAVGAVGGHLMHHGVLGAAGGCAAGITSATNTASMRRKCRNNRKCRK